MSSVPTKLQTQLQRQPQQPLPPQQPQQPLPPQQPVRIRVATVDDVPALLAIYAPYVLETAITFEYAVPSVAEFTSRMRKTLEFYPYLVAESAGQIVGYAYASAFHPRAAYQWCAEGSIYVDLLRRHGGVGRALYATLERVLQAQGILNLNACIAYCEAADEHLDRNSVDFHSHMGYRMVGRFTQCGYKFGRWYDMVWMEKFLGEHGENMVSPRSFAEVAASCALELGTN